MKTKRVAVYGVAIFVALLLALIYVFNPAYTIWAPKCPFKLLTGWQCGGCGCQRAIHALLHGNIWEAASYNLFLLYAIPYLMVLIAERVVLRGEIQMKVRKVAEHKYVVMFYVISYCVWMVIRNMLNI